MLERVLMANVKVMQESGTLKLATPTGITFTKLSIFFMQIRQTQFFQLLMWESDKSKISTCQRR